jgi:hypothetical protein
MAEVASQYDTVRQKMPSGPGRTQRMSQIVASMRVRAALVRSLLPEYQNSPLAGSRLAGIAVLHQFSNPFELHWLAERLDPGKETPFVGYPAVHALPLNFEQ